MIQSYKTNTCDVFAEFETKSNAWSLKILLFSGSASQSKNPEEFLIQNEMEERAFMNKVHDRYKKNDIDNGMLDNILGTCEMLRKTHCEVTLTVEGNKVYAKA